jgi:hypothetical protein
MSNFETGKFYKHPSGMMFLCLKIKDETTLVVIYIGTKIISYAWPLTTYKEFVFENSNS